jgi:hypothetical protein
MVRLPAVRSAELHAGHTVGLMLASLAGGGEGMVHSVVEGGATSTKRWLVPLSTIIA